MTTDTDTLTEKIRDEVAGFVTGSGYYATAIGVDEAAEIAAAVLPIVEAEVRRAKAEALREAAEDLFYDGDSDRPTYGHREMYDRADDIEAGDPDEHR